MKPTSQMKVTATPLISRFFKGLWFLLLQNGIKNLTSRGPQRAQLTRQGNVACVLASACAPSYKGFYRELCPHSAKEELMPPSPAQQSLGPCAHPGALPPCPAAPTAGRPGSSHRPLISFVAPLRVLSSGFRAVCGPRGKYLYKIESAVYAQYTLI